MKGRTSAREEDPMSTQPIQRPISPLRRRMLEDMAMRGLREETNQHQQGMVQALPSPVIAPGIEITLNRCARWKAIRKHPPLAPGLKDIEDRLDDPTKARPSRPTTA